MSYFAPGKLLAAYRQCGELDKDRISESDWQALKLYCRQIDETSRGVVTFCSELLYGGQVDQDTATHLREVIDPHLEQVTMDRYRRSYLDLPDRIRRKSWLDDDYKDLSWDEVEERLRANGGEN